VGPTGAKSVGPQVNRKRRGTDASAFRVLCELPQEVTTTGDPPVSLARRSRDTPTGHPIPPRQRLWPQSLSVSPRPRPSGYDGVVSAWRGANHHSLPKLVQQHPVTQCPLVDPDPHPLHERPPTAIFEAIDGGRRVRPILSFLASCGPSICVPSGSSGWPEGSPGSRGPSAPPWPLHASSRSSTA